MEFKDYYSILGVSKDADDKIIKKAYQKLANKYHPDVNPGDKKAEEKFKEISEAYQAISDPEKRRKYEDVRQNYEAWQKHGGQGDYDWSRWQAQPGKGSHTRTMAPEEFSKMFGNSGWGGNFSGKEGDFSDFFSTSLVTTQHVLNRARTENSKSVFHLKKCITEQPVSLIPVENASRQKSPKEYVQIQKYALLDKEPHSKISGF